MAVPVEGDLDHDGRRDLVAYVVTDFFQVTAHVISGALGSELWVDGDGTRPTTLVLPGGAEEGDDLLALEGDDTSFRLVRMDGDSGVIKDIISVALPPRLPPLEGSPFPIVPPRWIRLQFVPDMDHDLLPELLVTILDLPACSCPAVETLLVVSTLSGETLRERGFSDGARTFVHAAGDLDADGMGDLIIERVFQGESRITPWTAGEPAWTQVDPAASSHHPIAAGDVDANGADDLAILTLSQEEQTMQIAVRLVVIDGQTGEDFWSEQGVL